MSTAALQPAALFHEEQNFAWWIYLILGVMLAGAAAGLVWMVRADGSPRLVSLWSLQVPLYLAVGLGLPTILIVGVLRMTTRVTPGACLVWFGWVPTFRYAVALDLVESVEVVRYHPWTDSRGWGVRHGPDGVRILNARGDRGVRLIFTDGNRLLIGSQRPEELARAIEQARPPQT